MYINSSRHYCGAHCVNVFLSEGFPGAFTQECRQEATGCAQVVGIQPCVARCCHIFHRATGCTGGYALISLCESPLPTSFINRVAMKRHLAFIYLFLISSVSLVFWGGILMGTACGIFMVVLTCVTPQTINFFPVN